MGYILLIALCITIAAGGLLTIIYSFFSDNNMNVEGRTAGIVFVATGVITFLIQGPIGETSNSYFAVAGNPSAVTWIIPAIVGGICAAITFGIFRLWGVIGYRIHKKKSEQREEEYQKDIETYGEETAEKKRKQELQTAQEKIKQKEHRHYNRWLFLLRHDIVIGGIILICVFIGSCIVMYSVFGDEINTASEETKATEETEGTMSEEEILESVDEEVAKNADAGTSESVSESDVFKLGDATVTLDSDYWSKPTNEQKQKYGLEKVVPDNDKEVFRINDSLFIIADFRCYNNYDGDETAKELVVDATEHYSDIDDSGFSTNVTDPEEIEIGGETGAMVTATLYDDGVAFATNNVIILVYNDKMYHIIVSSQDYTESATEKIQDAISFK